MFKDVIQEDSMTSSFINYFLIRIGALTYIGKLQYSLKEADVGVFFY